MRTGAHARLDGNAPQASGSVRAPHLPAELRIRLTCRTVSEFLDRHAADVSRGGIFVRNAQVLAVGCTVRLNLQLADGSTLLGGEGTVFWTREADPTRAESEPGMGIRFTRLTAESQRMLTHLLAEKTERERHEDHSDFDEDERTVVATAEEIQAAATSADDASAPASFAPLASVPLPSPPAKPVATSSPPVTIFSDPVLPPRPATKPQSVARTSAPALTALPALAKVVALPAPSSHPVAIPAPVPASAPAPRVIEMTAMPPTHEPAAAAVRAAREIIDPALMATPAATSAAWETEDDKSSEPARSGEVELTDLVPRRGHSIGIGLAIGAISALVACLVFLFIVRPSPRRASASLAARTAAPAVAAPTAGPIEITPIAPLDPTPAPSTAPSPR
jgi:uncharacterized protein (TIGR02266 family)